MRLFGFDENEESRYSNPMKAILGFALANCAFFFLFSSCSFNYGNEADMGAIVPEMILTDVAASRYEDARLSMVLSAETLEMYDSDELWAGEKVSFVQYADDGSGSVDAEGAAGILLVDDSNEVYSLGMNATFHLLTDDLFFRAEDLRWTKKTHRLSSPIGGAVEIEESDGSVIRGTGFFADTLARTYEFANPVSGTLVNESQKDNKPDTPDEPKTVGDSTNVAE